MHVEGAAAEQTINPGRRAPLPTPLACIPLLSEALQDSHRQSLVCDLIGNDAQLMADYLDIVRANMLGMVAKLRKKT